MIKIMLIIGLGNPGEKYANTRHNIGFSVIDAFAQKNNFGDFKLNKKSEALLAENNFEGKKIILAKPQTFMNNSGNTVREIIKNSKLETKDLIVVHDDIDLPLGKIKIVEGRGSAGHKGVESIIKSLGEESFARIRLGIAPTSGKPENPESFVIGKFTKEEAAIKNRGLEKAVLALNAILQEGLEKAMNGFNV